MISVKCACGKKMSVGDALAGKVIRCSVCGEQILVAAGSWANGRVAVAEKKMHGGIYVSKGKIVFVCSLVAAVGLGMMFYCGPMSVWHQWDGMQPKARNTVQDVVTFALQAYDSAHADYDPSRPRFAPNVEGPDTMFTAPAMVMSMPEKVVFGGRSNEGPFLGQYNTRTGEIEGDIWYGGVSSSGLVDLRKPKGKFHVTGREVDGKVSAEADGEKLELVYPKKRDY